MEASLKKDFFGDVSLHTYSYGGVLYSTLPQSAIRNIFTTVFILLGLAISTFGKFFLRRRNLHQLKSKHAKSNAIPVTRMSSWLSFQDTLMYLWGTYRLPGGSFGLLMILTGCLGIMHQYFLNNFVDSKTITFPDSCTFQSGMITTKGSGIRSIPVSNWAAANTIQSAQNNVVYNSIIDNMGIWDLVNYDSSDFNPMLTDILGIWNCSQVASNPTIQFNTSSFTEILANATLYDRSLAFFYEGDNGWSFPNYDATGAFLWSGNETNDSNNSWSLRASMMGNAGISNNAQHQSTNLECNLNITKQSWKPPIIPISQTFQDEGWAGRIYGALMEADPSDYAYYLKLQLEAMTMISGSLNGDIWTASDLAKGQKSTYACTQPVTAIYPGIWVLVAALLLILIPMIIYDLGIIAYDFMRDGKAGLSTNAWLIENAPSGVGSWQLTLLKYTMNTDSLKSTDIKDYSYGWNPSKGEYEVNLSEAFQVCDPTVH
jgi:hypothetical protein